MSIRHLNFRKRDNQLVAHPQFLFKGQGLIILNPRDERIMSIRVGFREQLVDPGEGVPAAVFERKELPPDFLKMVEKLPSETIENVLKSLFPWHYFEWDTAEIGNEIIIQFDRVPQCDAIAWGMALI